jgi:hypothetical protein
MTTVLNFADVAPAIECDEFDTLVQEDVRVNDGFLSGDFIDHPEKMHKWGSLYERALDVETRLKNELARMYAKVDHNTRLELKSSGMKSTEKMVENTVITHPKYLEVLEEYHDAKLQTGLLKAAKDAMIHRRDMLIQLGASARAEGFSDISIREDAVKNMYKNK